MAIKKLQRIGDEPAVKKGLLSKIFALLHGPSGDDMGTLSHVRAVSSSQQDAMIKSPVDIPYVPKIAERKMFVEAEIAKARRPEQFAQRFN